MTLFEKMALIMFILTAIMLFNEWQWDRAVMTLLFMVAFLLGGKR